MDNSQHIDVVHELHEPWCEMRIYSKACNCGLPMVTKLAAENDYLRSQIDHIKAWIQQPDDNLSKAQLAQAIVRMCNDALKEDE